VSGACSVDGGANDGSDVVVGWPAIVVEGAGVLALGALASDGVPSSAGDSVGGVTSGVASGTTGGGG